MHDVPLRKHLYFERSFAKTKIAKMTWNKFIPRSFTYGEVESPYLTHTFITQQGVASNHSFCPLKRYIN